MEVKITKKFKQNLLIFSLVSVIILLIMESVFIAIRYDPLQWLISIPFVNNIFKSVSTLLEAKNYFGVYLFFSSAALFIFPTPLELFYFGFLTQGYYFPKLYFVTLLGVLTAQHINYFLGRFFGRLLTRFIRRKTEEKYRQRLEKYGQYFILFMHMFPLPYAILNFVIGVTRFHYLRWLMMATIGLSINYTIIYLVFVVF